MTQAKSPEENKEPITQPAVEKKEPNKGGREERKKFSQDLVDPMVKYRDLKIGEVADKGLKEKFGISSLKDLKPEDVSEAHPILMQALRDMVRGNARLEKSTEKYDQAFINAEKMLAEGADTMEVHAYLKEVTEIPKEGGDDSRDEYQAVAFMGIVLLEMDLLCKKYGQYSIAEELEDRFDGVMSKLEKIKE